MILFSRNYPNLLCFVFYFNPHIILIISGRSNSTISHFHFDHTSLLLSKLICFLEQTKLLSIMLPSAQLLWLCCLTTERGCAAPSAADCPSCHPVPCSALWPHLGCSNQKQPGTCQHRQSFAHNTKEILCSTKKSCYLKQYPTISELKMTFSPAFDSSLTHVFLVVLRLGLLEHHNVGVSIIYPVQNQFWSLFGITVLLENPVASNLQPSRCWLEIKLKNGEASFIIVPSSLARQTAMRFSRNHSRLSIW